MPGADRLRLALDATPLLGARTGIGEVVAGILGELAPRADLEVTGYADRKSTRLNSSHRT